MVRFVRHTILLLLVMAPVSTLAQESVDTVSNLPGIEIETSVDKAEIYVGDLLNYSVVITYDSTYELIPPPLGANLGAFDVKDYQTDLMSRLPDGRLRSTNNFVLSTFTTGDYVIPPIPAAFNLPDSSRKMLLSEGVPIKVLSLLAESGDSLDVHPLKDPFEFKRDYTMYYLWGGAGLLALIVIGLWLWVRYRRRQGIMEQIDLRPPWEIAFERLAFLQEKNLPGREEFKAYYIELTEIARFYLGRMYQSNVLDMTTEEFLTDFATRELPANLFEAISDFLGHADLVKFAKMIPEREQVDTDLTFVHDLIAAVRDEFERRNAAEQAGVVRSEALGGGRS